MSAALNMTGDQIVAAALRKLAVLGDGLLPSPTQLAGGKETLNVMLKSFETKSISNVFENGIPEYWLEAVIYGLAYRLSPDYGIPLQDRQLLMGEAARFLQEAVEFSNDDPGSLFLQPDWTTYQ